MDNDTLREAVPGPSGKTIWLGIDPGSSGGIAALDVSGVVSVIKMPATEADVVARIHQWSVGYLPCAVIEKVGSMPGQGVVSMFTFGRNVGLLRGSLLGARIPFEEVTPGVWQKEFGLIRSNKSESAVQKKNRHKGRAQELFPHVSVTHAIADALLIAEWLRRRDKGILK